MLAEKAQREAEERFATRMTSLDESFVLEDQEREIIASDIKDMTDEQFASHIEKLDVLLKSRKREVVEAMERQQAEEAKASDEEVKEEASAETVVEEVVENAESQDEEVPNTIEASEPTVFDKYKSAFSVDQFEIK